MSEEFRTEGFTEKATIMDSAAVGRAITRISHEILEKHKGCSDVVLVGIRRRGVPMAKRIAEKMAEIEGAGDIPNYALDITFYRDDLTKVSASPVINNDELVASYVDGKHVIIVDDVIFTGRTVRAAIEAIFRHGRPQTVELAVMIDRGLRELPLRPDYVGKNIPTSRSEIVSVKLAEIDGIDSVSILSAK